MGASHRRIADMAALALIAGLFATNVYRAATQSLTCDEAYSFDLYMDAPVASAFTGGFSGNDHVLFTFLSRVGVGLFGKSELALRLVSLLGGLLYLVFAYRLSRRLFQRPWMMLLSVSLLTLNPFVLDYLSAARGYGMALGLFLGALYCVVTALEQSNWEAGAKQLGLASFLLGLSIAANLTFLFPSVALAGVLTAAWMADSEDHSGLSQKLVRALETCWLPMIVTAFILLVIPLSRAHRDDFNYGADSMFEASASVVQPSLLHRRDLMAFGPLRHAMVQAGDFISRWMVALVLAALGGWLARILALWLRSRRIRSLGRLDRVSLVITGTLLVSLAGVIAGHLIGGLRYPAGRTAIYLVPLLVLAWLTWAARCFESAQLPLTKGILVCLPAMAAVAAFLAGFTTEYYYEWRSDAGNKPIFQILKQQGPGGKRPARLGVNWNLWPGANYYRKRYGLNWMEPVTTAPMSDGGFDFYILVLPDDQATLDRVRLKILYRDPISGEQLGIPLP
jgi:hypothetical protein